MTEQEIISLLYTIYGAGYNHGYNETAIPKVGVFDAFNRLIIGESPQMDGQFYAIKEKVEKLFSLANEK